MKLKRITIENFRQYYGKQVIDFACDDKNVTIIYGSNGKGKTGLFRALMFALYGSERLAQDTNISNIHLINFKKLEEANGQPITATVKLEFEHKNCEYVVERSMTGYKRGETIKEQVQDVAFSCKDADGQISSTPVIDQDEVKRRIDAILHSGIKDFFIFDAEKIDELTKNDSEERESIKKGILKLLQIEHVEKAKKLCENLHRSESTRIAKESSNIRLSEIEDNISKLENDIAALTIEIDEKEKEKALCSKEYEDNKRKIESNKENEKLVNDQAEIKKNIEQIKNHLNDAEENVRECLKNKCSIVLGEEVINQANAIVSQVMNDNTNMIDRNLLRNSISNNKCLCCNRELDDDLIKRMEELIKTIKVNEDQYIINSISQNAENADFTSHKMFIGDKITKYADLIKQLDKEKKKNDDLEEKMSDNAETLLNLSGIKEAQEKIKEKMDNFTLDIKELIRKITLAQKDLEKSKVEAEEERKKDASKKFDNKVLEKIKQFKDALTIIEDEYCKEMREKLAKETNRIVNQILDVSSLIQDVEISSNYEIKLKNWDQEITGDISQGQRQVVALAYITALAKLASGNGDTIDFPLFMDTPFARISGDNRDNLIENIPNLTSQWVLLLTDTELTVSEEKKFKETGKLGNWYNLEQIDATHTNIIPCSLDVRMAKRGE